MREAAGHGLGSVGKFHKLPESLTAVDPAPTLAYSGPAVKFPGSKNTNPDRVPDSITGSDLLLSYRPKSAFGAHGQGHR